MILVHYSASKDLALDRTRTYEQTSGSSYDKPRGLWVSVVGKDDWEKWCEGEGGFAADKRVARYAVLLGQAANVLQLSSPTDLDLFTERYGFPGEYSSRVYSDSRCIGWPTVARDYQGIIIAPYQWKRRLELDWYYGWDCASGCIWDLSATKEFTPLAAEDSKAVAS